MAATHAIAGLSEGVTPTRRAHAYPAAPPSGDDSFAPEGAYAHPYHVFITGPVCGVLDGRPSTCRIAANVSHSCDEKTQSDPYSAGSDGYKYAFS